MPVRTITATVHMRMGMVIRMAIGALTTGIAVTIRIAALTTLTIAPTIDMRRIADIGSHLGSSNCSRLLGRTWRTTPR